MPRGMPWPRELLWTGARTWPRGRVYWEQGKRFGRVQQVAGAPVGVELRTGM